MLRARLGRRVIVEHAALTAGFHLGQFFEAGGQAVRIDAALFQQIERVIIRFAFLLLRELGADQLLADVRQLRLRQRADNAAGGGRRGAQRHGAVSHLHRFTGVAQRHVAHFVAQHAFHFVVVHDVHQAAVNADTAVGHRPGVDVFGHVDLVVGRGAVDVVAQRRSDFVETLGIGAVGRRDLCLAVHLGAGFITQGLNVVVAQGRRLERLRAGLHQGFGIQVLTAGCQGGNAQRNQRGTDLHNAIFL